MEPTKQKKSKWRRVPEDTCRMIYKMHKESGLPNTEIAKKFYVSEACVRGIIKRLGGKIVAAKEIIEKNEGTKPPVMKVKITRTSDKKDCNTLLKDLTELITYKLQADIKRLENEEQTEMSAKELTDLYNVIAPYAMKKLGVKDVGKDDPEASTTNVKFELYKNDLKNVN